MWSSGPTCISSAKRRGWRRSSREDPRFPASPDRSCSGSSPRPPNDNPTLVNNVETLANVPRILAEGSGWLRANGTSAHRAGCCSPYAATSGERASSSCPRDPAATLGGGPGREGRAEGRALKAIFPGASNTVSSRSSSIRRWTSIRCARPVRAWGRAGSRSSTTPRAWFVRRTSTRASSGWSPAANARPASSAPGRSPEAWMRSSAGVARRISRLILARAEELHRRPEVRPPHGREPPHSERGAGLRRRVPRPRRRDVSSASGAPLPQDRRLGPHAEPVRVRPLLRKQTPGLDLRLVTAHMPVRGFARVFFRCLSSVLRGNLRASRSRRDRARTCRSHAEAARSPRRPDARAAPTP